MKHRLSNLHGNQQVSPIQAITAARNDDKPPPGMKSVRFDSLHPAPYLIITAFGVHAAAE